MERFTTSTPGRNGSWLRCCRSSRRQQRESVYEIKVIDVAQAGVGIHERLVLLISRVALGLLSADELQAVVAHEIGHEYVWADRERAVAVGDHERLQDLELVCDIIAVTILRGIGRDASPLIAGIRNHRFHTPTLGRRSTSTAIRRWIDAALSSGQSRGMRRNDHKRLCS